MHLNTAGQRFTFSAIGIILVLISIMISFFSGTEVGGKKAIIFDDKVISAFQNISKKVPYDERIITGSFTPIVMYFTGREAITPYAVSSYDSLLNYMHDKNYSYLLVFENRSEIADLSENFKKENLSSLAKNFKEIETYATEFNKIHLYKRVT